MITNLIKLLYSIYLAHFEETFVQRKIMTNRIFPTNVISAEKWISINFQNNKLVIMKTKTYPKNLLDPHCAVTDHWRLKCNIYKQIVCESVRESRK